MKTDLQNLQHDLQEALELMNENWSKQNNHDDRNTKFIYDTTSLKEVIKKSKQNNFDLNYVLHRWYNYQTSQICENFFIKYGAIKEQNKYHKTIDFYIYNTAFDLKVTVFPKKLYSEKKLYNLKSRVGKNKLIKWYYINQSQEQRKHMANRLFIVCDGKNPIKLKSDFDKIEEHIVSFIEYYKTRSFNELQIEYSGKLYNVKSEILYITD